MADAPNPIPSVQPSDSEDVELALETSQRMYQKGDLPEALKWLRRAASSAEEAGDDMRQLQLARLAADLASAIDSGPAVLTSAPSLPPTAPSKAPGRLPQPPPSKQPPPAPSARAAASPGPAPSGTQGGKSPASVPPPSASESPPAPAVASSSAPAPIKSKPVPATPSASTRPPPESQTPPPRIIDSQTPNAVSIKPKATPSATGSIVPSARLTTLSSSPPPKPEKSLGGNGTSRVLDPAATPNAVRVSVRISGRDESLYIVRPLAEGQKLPPGAREAHLVFGDD